MTNFRITDRETNFLMPPSIDEWLPPRHLARFVVEAVDGLDLSAMSKSYRGSGSASYHPAVLLSLLVYGCATGVFSSRKLERATYDSVAFRFIAANDHPDHDTIATFRRRFLKSDFDTLIQNTVYDQLLTARPKVVGTTDVPRCGFRLTTDRAVAERRVGSSAAGQPRRLGTRRRR